MANPRWTIKELGAELGIHPNKAPQAVKPAAKKIARLMMDDAYKTNLMLLDAMQEIMAEDNYEIEQRILMQTGKLDHPATLTSS